MSLQELKEQVLNLPAKERLVLISAIAQSLQEDSAISQSDAEGNMLYNRASQARTNLRYSAIERMRGLLKTDETALTDDQVAAMLEERRMEKYLR